MCRCRCMQVQLQIPLTLPLARRGAGDVPELHQVTVCVLFPELCVSGDITTDLPCGGAALAEARSVCSAALRRAEVFAPCREVSIAHRGSLTSRLTPASGHRHTLEVSNIQPSRKKKLYLQCAIQNFYIFSTGFSDAHFLSDSSEQRRIIAVSVRVKSKQTGTNTSKHFCIKALSEVKNM